MRRVPEHRQAHLPGRPVADPEVEKRTAIEVVANQMQILDRAPTSGNGAKADESSKAAGPVDEGDNTFEETRSEAADSEIQF
jgi:hypothetical protein